MPKARPPARLAVLMARDAPYAVIIRRGPFKHVCTVGWHRRTDTFELGQWMVGRIYEDRCDISPDGNHLIYFVAKFLYRTRERESWTAISRTPYLKAVGLWDNGTTWFGGGLFLSNAKVLLNGLQSTVQRQPAGMRVVLDRHAATTSRHVGNDFLPDGIEMVNDLDVHLGAEEREVFVASRRKMHDNHIRFRTYRDGWRLDEEGREGGRAGGMGKHATRDWWLRKPIGDSGYKLVSRHGAQTVALPGDAEWAEVDRHGKVAKLPREQRVVWTAKGCLFRAPVTRQGLGKAQLLRDFNDMEFEAIAAPY